MRPRKSALVEIGPVFYQAEKRNANVAQTRPQSTLAYFAPSPRRSQNPASAAGHYQPTQNEVAPFPLQES